MTISGSSSVPLITEKVAWAASLGDRSENADYQYNKRLLRHIDSRVRYLKITMSNIKVADYRPDQEGTVYIGAYVEIENDDETRKLSFRIVGEDELFGRSDVITVDSPMGKALLGKKVDDEAAVETPGGTKYWHVSSISYRPRVKRRVSVGDYVDLECATRTGTGLSSSRKIRLTPLSRMPSVRTPISRAQYSAGRRGRSSP